MFCVGRVKSQDSYNSLDVIDAWKNNSNYCEFLYNDFSSVFYYDQCSYLGVFGRNKRKIHIRLDSVFKVTSDRYSVVGSSLLKENVCLFKGEIKIERIEFVHLDVEGSELWLALVGSYKFAEDNSCGGIFQGKYRKYFVYNWQDKKIQHADSYMELGEEEGFAGVWIDEKKGKSYPCHFGFYRYPSELAGDFDYGGGEPIINPKYRSYGWEPYFQEGNLGFYRQRDCKDQWWE